MFFRILDRLEEILIASLIAWIASAWLGYPLSFLIVAVVMIVAIVPFIVLIRRYAGKLSMRATRRQLRGLGNAGKD